MSDLTLEKSYDKVLFSPLEGETPRPLEALTSKELTELGDLKAHIEVVYGSTTLTLKELAALNEGDLLPLNELCDDLVDIYVNKEHIGRGEVIAHEGKFGVKIVTLEN